MTVKVKIKIDLKLNRLIPNIEKEFTRKISDNVPDLIRDRIATGKSPVKGKRWKDYSVTYAKKKGRLKPVDMKGEGRMLRDCRARRTTKGIVLIDFSNNKIAEYHDQLGAGKSKVTRPLLPSHAGENFTPSIFRKICGMLKDAVKFGTLRQR